MGKFFKASILAAGLLCLGTLQSAKADAIYTVTVTNVTTGYCMGGLCSQTILGVGGSETATVDFGSNGAFTLTETSKSLGTGTASAVDASLPASSLEMLTLGYSPDPVICSTTTPNFTVSGTTLTPGSGSECSASLAFTFPGSLIASQSGGWLTYDGSNTWTLTDNSFALTFTTTSTPEPSSLLMLGSGLLGLMGLGFRRKALV